MSDSDIIATPRHEPDMPAGEDRVHDEEDRLRPSFVREVLDAVADGDDGAARELVGDVHPPALAALSELAPRARRRTRCPARHRRPRRADRGPRGGCPAGGAEGYGAPRPGGRRRSARLSG